MEFGQVLFATGVGAIILFLWTGFAQNVLPWGVKSVQQYTTQDELSSNLVKLTPKGMVYVKAEVAAFIAIRPASYYSMSRYFGFELVTQIIAAAVLAAILSLTTGLPDTQRLLLVALTGAAGIASVDGQYWNWWGFSSYYTLGVAINRLIGYLLAAAVMITWIL